jgi:hypothetical protein
VLTLSYNPAARLTFMHQLPLVLQSSRPSSGQDHPGIDAATSEDPLPAVLESTADGYILARGTTVTDVRHETTDDK